MPRKRADQPRTRKKNTNNLVLLVAAVVGLVAVVAITVVIILMVLMTGPQGPTAQPPVATPSQPQPEPVQPIENLGSPLIVAAGRSPIPQADEEFKQPIAASRLIPANQPTAPNHAISYTDAPQYLGQQVIVEGVIRDGRVVSDGALNLLYFTKAQDDSFYLAMFQSAYDAVQGVPSESLLNKKVRVTGPVTTHRGRPQIQINTPDQITILETPVVAIPDPETVERPEENAPDDEPEVKPGEVPWQKAHEHVGKEITVVGKIVNTRNIGSHTFLNYDHNWQGKFYIVVYDEVYKDIPGGDPATFYKDKNLKITGRVDMFESDRPGAVKRPQIKVRDVKQITVVE